MLQNAFAGQAKRPTEKSLGSALGESIELWNSLVDDLKREFQLAGEWHSSSVKLGWSLRLQLKKRNIVYLGPRRGSFLAAFALGDRAVAAARAGELPPHIVKTIAEARRYAEGTAVRIEVKTAEDVEIVKRLVKIKIEN